MEFDFELIHRARVRHLPVESLSWPPTTAIEIKDEDD